MDKEKRSHLSHKNEPQLNYGISHLRCREMQAPIVVALINGFARHMGHDKAIEVATEIIKADAVNAGREMAERYGGNTMVELASIVREVWSRDNAMAISVLEETEKNFYFNVTRCGYAEVYEKLGMKEFGVCLSCSRDEPFIEGFNSQIKLNRSQTIMEGEAYCDFRYSME